MKKYVYKLVNGIMFVLLLGACSDEKVAVSGEVKKGKEQL